MVTLEKLPKLRILVLLLSTSMIKKMVRTSRGFLQLETLELRHSKELEELIVEEGAMPYLNALVIESCLIMKKISPRLLQLTNLQYLTLLHLSHELIDEVTQIKEKD